MNRDYYQILGVAPSADAEVIKKAYRRLAFRYHPDRNQDDAAQIALFQECTEAYQVLGNPERRRLYDLYGIEWSRSEVMSQNELEALLGSVTRLFEGLVEVDASERPPRPDLYSEVEISLEEAALGSQAIITVDPKEPCARCARQGQAQGPTKPCPRCGGQGRLNRPQGLVTLALTCPDCRGSGRVSAQPCPVCGGTRYISVKRQLEVRVPPGIHDGQYLRVKGEGQSLPQGGRGELFVKVRIRPHAVFHRRGDDLYRRLEIKPSLAVGGGVAQVETLVDGVRGITLAPGSSGGEVARLPGLGMPRRGGMGRGDLVVEVVVAGAALRGGGASVFSQREDPVYVRNLKALFRLPGHPAALKLNRKVAATALGRKRTWDFRRLDHCLDLMLLYLKKRRPEDLSVTDRSELMGLARLVSERARSEALPTLRGKLLEVNQGLLHLATASSEPARAEAHGETGPDGSLEVSYHSLVEQARDRLVGLFMDHYVAGIFSLPRKLMARARFGRMLGEFFSWVEDHYQAGQDRELFIDVHTTSFVAKHKTLLKTMCLNLSRRYKRPITLYHFETYLSEALTHFYRMLDAHQTQSPGMIVDLPPALTHRPRQDRRREPRRVVEVPVQCTNGGGGLMQGQSRDVSQDGVRLWLSGGRELSPGDALSCRLEPQPGDALDMAGVVAWREAREGGAQEAGLELQWSSDPRQLRLWLQVLESSANP